MSALPLGSLLLVLALAGCPSAPRTGEPSTDTGATGATGGAIRPTPLDTMAGATQQDPHLLTATQSGFGGPEQLVLRDRAAWEGAWARLHEGAPPPLPAVDFAREMVVVLALGSRNSGGYAVRFDAIEASGADATVRYTVTEPGPGCMTTQAITAPVDVVRVPRAAGTVRFTPRTVREPC